MLGDCWAPGDGLCAGRAVPVLPTAVLPGLCFMGPPELNRQDVASARAGDLLGEWVGVQSGVYSEALKCAMWLHAPCLRWGGRPIA